MAPKTSTSDNWRFSIAVLLPVLVALIVTASAVLGFVFWSTANIDQRALERQNAMLEQLMAAHRDDIQRELRGVAHRDEAVVNTRLMFSYGWVHANIGRWMHDLFGTNRAVVLNAASHPLYMMEDGVAVDVNAYGRIAGPIQALAGRLRTVAPAAPLPPGTVPQPRSATDFAVVEGMPAIVSVMTITSDTGAVLQTPGTEPLVAAVHFLDAAAAAQLGRQHLFENGQFTLARGNGEHRANFPILNEAGRFIAFFEWDRERPGQMLLNQTGPILIAAFVAASLMVYLLLRQLRRFSVALAAGRRQAEHQAAHDRLTGLPNRLNFDRHLARTLTGAQQEPVRLSLLMLDLDRFKQVNDTLGHQAGDELICAVGQRIRGVIGEDAMLARLGGDEFAMLLAERDRHGAEALAARIVEAVGRPFDLNHFKAHVGASIGIVHIEGEAEPRELLRKADIALYEAKAGGRNRAVVYEEHMNELLQLQHTIEAELRLALEGGDQLSVVFQPLVDQCSRKVIGAEALARWHHPKYGQISPARFIPVAENTGLIEALGEKVLRSACTLGATAPGRTIAVNISPTQLRNPDFSVLVFDILHQTGMRPVDLELEITESILLDDEHVSAQNLRTFRSAGIHIALDDFGTGYSSLSYLKRYPVDRIKIDRSFVCQLAEGHVSVAITQAMVTLAHAMDIEVTAEGVETETQAAILGRLGCNILQGFLFSGGVSPDAISAVFADKANTPDRRRRSAA